MTTLSWKGAAVALATLMTAGVAGEAYAQYSSRSAPAAERERQRRAQEQADEARERGETRSTSDRPRRTRAADPTQIAEVQRTRGAAEAPAIAQAASLNCQVADALWLGASGEGEAAQNLYEVACTGGVGYILVTRPAPQPPQAIDCLQQKTIADREDAAGNAGQQRCRLPANANPAATLQPVVAQTGRTCTVSNGRALGRTDTLVRYELACSEGGSYIIDAPLPGQTSRPAALSCLEAAASNITCEFTTREQLITNVRPLLTGPAASCQVSDIRFAGRPREAARAANEVIEVACGETGGYLIEASPQGAVINSWSCSSAEARGIGCQLTNQQVAQTQEIEIYTTAATAIGLNCPVSQYRRVGLEGPESGREVVELLCTGETEARMAYLPVPGRPNQNGEAIDCLRAEARAGTNVNLRCRLTQVSALYPRLQQQLTAANFPCAVSAVRGVGRLNNEDMVEFACDATQRGGFVALPVGQTGIGRAIRCSEAAQMGLPCALPGNAAGARPAS